MLRENLHKNPFTTPNGYFDSLPTRVQEKCGTHTKLGVTQRVVALKHQWAYVASFAALALLTYGGITLVGNNGNTIGNSQANTLKENKEKAIQATSFMRNNAKLYAQFTEPAPILGNEDNATIQTVNNVDEMVMDYLAVETNISTEDILGLE